MDKQLLADLLLIVSVLAAAFCIAQGLLMEQPRFFAGALLLALGGSLAYLVLNHGNPHTDDPWK